MPLGSFFSRFRRTTQETAPVAEALDAPTPAQVRRVGYEYGIALATQNTSSLTSATSERQQVLAQLHQAYMACNWVSASIDLIARTVTAGGIQIVAEADANGDTPEDTPQVTRLRRLMRFCNPREDMVQLLRNVATDLMLFGDAYLEIVSLLGEPVALYTLDATTMTVISDQHGEVSGYIQDVDGVRTARFDADQVIHISLDAPRGGLYGVSPAQKCLLPITSWLFWAATLKECGRRGDPPRVHVDLGHFQDTDVQRWREQYRVFNLGPKAVGEPLLTTGGAIVQVLDGRKVTDYLDADRQLRDQIISTFGVPPAKLGIIETGNLGSGSGEAQDKAMDLATPIPTPTGWTTMGELKVGNVVLDEAGRPCNVTGTYEVPDAESWRLEFSDGTHIDCCADHLWTTWTYADRKAFGRTTSRDGKALPDNWPTWRSGRGKGPQTRRTAEIIETLRHPTRGDSNHSVPVTGALQLPDAALPIDPYTLGVWLGDGTGISGAVTCGIGDEQMLDEIRAAGYGITEQAAARRSGRTPYYTITGLRTALRGASLLGDKHVPSAYLRGSEAQRLGLLQGLMDADGGFSSGQQVLFRNTNERLADAVVELARSLGQKPVKAKGRAMLNGVDCGPQYGVTWTPTIQVFRLARKADKWSPKQRATMQLQHRTIVSATKIPDRPMRCIRVDSPNHMYLAGEAMIPTHNTFRVNTIIPVANLILEKLNFHLLQEGFGITDWHLEFNEIDYRDSLIVEEIREKRLNSGAYTINRWRMEIGEPPIEGGDDAILMDRQGPVFWTDIAAFSRAMIAYRTAPLSAAGVNGYVPGVPDAELDPTPDPVAKQPDSAAPPKDPEDGPGLSKDATQGTPPEELWDDLYRRLLDEALAKV
jgi:phage portal protein BeeE